MRTEMQDLPNVNDEAFALPDPELLHRPIERTVRAFFSAVRITARTVVQPFRYGGSGPSPSSVRCGNQDFRSLRPPSSGRRTCDPREGPGASRIVGVVGRSSLVQSGTPRRDDWDHESADRLDSVVNRRGAADARQNAGRDAGVRRFSIVQCRQPTPRSRSMDANDYDLNQSSVAKAYEQFEETGRMKPAPYHDRIVDVMEELMKFTLSTRGVSGYLTDRYSERKEAAKKPREAIESRSGSVRTGDRCEDGTILAITQRSRRVSSHPGRSRLRRKLQALDGCQVGKDHFCQIVDRQPTADCKRRRLRCCRLLPEKEWPPQEACQSPHPRQA